MPLNDAQVQALRAQLEGDYDEHKRLLAALANAGDLRGYMDLVTAAFVEVVTRRFGQHTTDEAVIEYIAEVRSRYPGAEDEIDPRAAERLVLMVLGTGDVDDLDDATVRKLERLLLPVMAADEQLDGPGLDRLLADARKLAES